MQTSDVPSRISVPFANTAGGSYIRSIPQTTATTGRASFDKGFPPETFLDEGAGGIPPDGRDFNGILNQITAWVRWQAAGAAATYNADFATDIGGYPLNAILASTTPGIFWRSTANNNATDPDGGSPANWERVSASSAAVIAGTSTTRLVTPKSLKDAGLVFPASPPTFAPTWERFNLDGSIEKGGTQNFSSQTEHIEGLVFPTPFPTECLDIQLTVIGSGGYTGSTMVYQLTGSLTAAGCSIQVNSQTSTFNDAVGFRWRALGY